MLLDKIPGTGCLGPVDHLAIDGSLEQIKRLDEGGDRRWRLRKWPRISDGAQ